MTATFLFFLSIAHADTPTCRPLVPREARAERKFAAAIQEWTARVQIPMPAASNYVSGTCRESDLIPYIAAEILVLSKRDTEFETMCAAQGPGKRALRTMLPPLRTLDRSARRALPEYPRTPWVGSAVVTSMRRLLGKLRNDCDG